MTVVLSTLKEAFTFVGYSHEPEGSSSLAEVGNPVMALAAFLAQLDTTMLDDKDLEDDHQKTKIASDASVDKIHLASTNGLPEKSTSKEQAMINHESGLDNCDDPCVSKANQRIERPQNCQIRAKTRLATAESIPGCDRNVEVLDSTYKTSQGPSVDILSRNRTRLSINDILKSWLSTSQALVANAASQGYEQEVIVVYRLGIIRLRGQCPALSNKLAIVIANQPSGFNYSVKIQHKAEP
ncbi:hypothetical protein KIW84_062541 [Lathyrus oleraceus]|uniref:Uncharacterized protein n=1 Tax=Pisum sativum TaxID=3888 RepID=A0A9D4W652_PEA|nr:hypothetical protein KIW84_062541 [Pisum sativum]